MVDVLTAASWAGVESGTVFRMEGMGARPSPDMKDKVLPGSVIVEVRVSDSTVYEREGFNVVVKASLAFTDAILGTSLK